MKNYKFFSLADDIAEAKQNGFADTVSHEILAGPIMGIFISIVTCIGSVVLNVATPSDDLTSIALKSFQILFSFAICWLLLSKLRLRRKQLIVGLGSSGICFNPTGYKNQLITIPWKHILTTHSFCSDGSDLFIVKTSIDINDYMLGGISNGTLKTNNNLYELEFYLGTNAYDFSDISLCQLRNQLRLENSERSTNKS